MSDSPDMASTGPAPAEAGPLGREFALLFDQVIEVALGGLFRAVAERRLGFAEVLVFRALGNGSPVSGIASRPFMQADLSRLTGLSDSTVADVCRHLESHQLIVSAAGTTVTLTDSGRSLLRELHSRRLDALTDFVARQDPGERLRLAGALQLLDTRFNERLGLKGS